MKDAYSSVQVGLLLLVSINSYSSTNCEEDIKDLGVLIRMHILRTGDTPTQQEGFQAVLHHAEKPINLKDKEGFIYRYEVFNYQNSEYVKITSANPECKYLGQFKSRKIT